VSHFRISSVALRTEGIGGVGTSCQILLIEVVTKSYALTLQLKEAGPPALRPYIAKHAQCVEVGQKLMQAASDIFLAGIKVR